MNIGPFSQEAPQEMHPNYLAFYASIFKQLTPRKFPFYKTFCPFHKDLKTPNLHINIALGTYICFACGAEGTEYDFVIKKVENNYKFYVPDYVRDPEEIKRIASEKQEKKEMSDLDRAVEVRRSEIAHEFLFQQPMALKHLQNDRGFTLETIKEWTLGFMKGVITFPIYDKQGNLSAFKFHKKMQCGDGINQLYPWKAVIYNNTPYNLLVEGEPDMWILRQNGFNAVTQIDGANAWDDSFTPYFKKKPVFIAYDNDTAGKEAAFERALDFWRNGIHSYIIQWPSFMGYKEDHIDFFVRHQKTAQDYKELLSKAKSILSFELGNIK